MAKKKEARQEADPVRQKQFVEVISQKDALQVQGRKAAEKQKVWLFSEPNFLQCRHLIDASTLFLLYIINDL
jgi:hypothetical protein